MIPIVPGTFFVKLISQQGRQFEKGDYHDTVEQFSDGVSFCDCSSPQVSA